MKLSHPKLFRREDFSAADVDKLNNGTAFKSIESMQNQGTEGGGGGGNGQQQQQNQGAGGGAGGNGQQQQQQNQGQQQQGAGQGAAAAGQQQQQNQGQQGQGQNNQQQQEEFKGYDYRTRGFKTHEELEQRLDTLPALEKKLKDAEAAPKFKSEKEKFLYEFATRHEGMELEAAQTILSLSRIDVSKLPDQQARFEVFKLKPENKGLTEDQLKTLFIDDEKNQFGDSTVENGQSPAQKVRADVATRTAKEQLNKMKDDFSKARPAEQSAQDIIAAQTAYRSHVKESLGSFAGLDFKLSATDEGGKKLEGTMNFKFDAEQMKSLTEALVDPQGMWARVLEEGKIMLPDGQVDIPKFANLLGGMLNQEKLMNNAYYQGRQDERSDTLKNRRNNDAGNNGDGGNPAGAGAASGKSETQQMGEAALKVVGIK